MGSCLSPLGWSSWVLCVGKRVFMILGGQRDWLWQGFSHQPRCPSIEGCIKKMWYIYTMEYYLIHKKEWNVICSDTDGLRDYHTTWSKSDRERQIYDITYKWNLNKWHKWIYLQNRDRLIDLENEHMVTRGEGWERGTDWEFGMDTYTLLYLKCITNQDLLYSTGNSAQYYQPK